MAAELFTKEDLEAFLQRRHDEDPTDGIEDDDSAGIPKATFNVVHRLVKAWLLDATGLEALPIDSDRLWGWGIELAALAIANPESTSATTTDRVVKTWAAGDAHRRDAILARAAQWAHDMQPSVLVPAPKGSFPDPESLPEDLLPLPRRRWPR